MKILSFIISIQFILNPLFIQKTHAQSCSPGLQFNPQLNRCLTSNEVASVMQSTQNCSQTDHECYMSNAQAALSQRGNMDRSHDNHSFKSDNWGKASKYINASAVAIPLVGAITQLKNMKQEKSTCASISWYVMLAAGSTLFASDLILNQIHKKKIQEIHDDWKKIVPEPDEVSSNVDDIRKNGTEAQSQAFEMLARSEDQMVKTAKAKETFFWVAASTFAAAMTISLYEALSKKGVNICKSSHFVTPEKSFSDRIATLFSTEEKQKNYSEIIQLSGNFNTIKKYNLSQAQNMSDLLSVQLEAENLIPNYHSLISEDIKPINDLIITNDQFALVKKMLIGFWDEMSFVKAGYAQEKGNTETSTSGAPPTTPPPPTPETKLQKLVGKPWGRVAVALVLGTWSGVMANHAKKQAEASEERAKLLRTMKNEFDYASSAINVCGSEERNDSSKPGCYCFNSDHSRNASRVNSQVCATLWGKFKPAGLADNSPNVGKLGCVNVNGNYDSDCKCKKSKSCLKIGQSNINMNSGMFSVVNSGLAPVNSMANGDFNYAGINTNGISTNAMRAMNLNKKLLENKPKIKSQLESIAESFHNDAMKSSAALSGSPLAGNSNSPLPTNPAEAARMLEKEVESSSEPSGASTNKGTISLNPENGDEMPDLGLTPAQTTDNQVAEVMKENFDYGGSDITSTPSSNIFEVLSNRYHRSGLRRLFDDKGVTSADKPSDSDISKK